MKSSLFLLIFSLNAYSFQFLSMNDFKNSYDDFVSSPKLTDTHFAYCVDSFNSYSKALEKMSKQDSSVIPSSPVIRNKNSIGFGGIFRGKLGNFFVNTKTKQVGETHLK
jgi:hypothetical protein